MSSNNAGAIKKMSLEEFLGDDTLGDSVWNEDEINLDAISNTTNIDFLKNKPGSDNYDSGMNPHNHNRSHGQHGFDFHHKAGYGRDDDGAGPSFAMQGPPYIIKFSQLPPKFSDDDIHDLFHEKFTKFVKFKLFWELNRNPSIDVLKTGSIFDQNFKRVAKVGFVELYTGRDMEKILKYWAAPLLKIHSIKVEPAQFDDFKEYRTKVELLTDPSDDAGKPYNIPRKKSNPFGAARPVDTQSKILAIEEKVGKLHIEDTKTLRRLSEGEYSSDPHVLKPGKVQILKKPIREGVPVDDDAYNATDSSKKPLSYVDVIKKSGGDSKKNSPPTSSNSTALSSPKVAKNVLYSNNSSNKIPSTTVGEGGADSIAASQENQQDSNIDEEHSDLVTPEDIANDSSFTFKDSERNNEEGFSRNSYGDQRQQKGGRGGGYFRGNNNSSHRRGGARGGGGRGGSNPHQSRYSNSRDSNDNENYQTKKFNGFKGNQSYEQKASSQNYNHSNQNQQGQDEKRYSMFKPASGFLWEGGKNTTGHQNTRGGFNNNYRGSHRGGFNNRNRHNNGFAPA